MEIGESVHRAEIRELVFFNSHGGQPQVIDLVARDLRVQYGMLAVALNHNRLLDPDGLFPEGEMKHGIQAGTKETSLMLFLRRDLVRSEKAKLFETLSEKMEEEFRFLSPEGRMGFGWQVQDLNSAGGCGDATDSAAERGESMIDQMARISWKCSKK